MNAIKNQIEDLESSDLRNADEDHLRREVLNLMAVYGGRQIGLNPSNRFYRVRRNLDERLRNAKGLESYPPLFRELRLIWYPPAQSCQTRGRVNRVGESVFYCADSIDTAVLEMRPKVGEYLTILECAFTTEDAKPNIFEAGIHEGPGRFNPNYGASAPEADQEYQSFLDQQGIAEQTSLVRAFMVKQFTRIVEAGSEHEYKITNAIASVLFEEFAFVRKTDFMPEDIKADGIAYASIAAEAKGANIAFTCEAADRLMKPTACGVFIVEESPTNPWGAIRRTHRAQEITTSGEIIW